MDDRLVAEDCGYEIYDGRLVPVPPCREPHGEFHSKLAALLESHTRHEYKVALDMLTRTSELSDIAPDASVYPRARTPEGGRQLEELAFEIANTQTRENAGRKARMLFARGVRRIFLIDLEPLEVLEWSGDLDDWVLVPDDRHLNDPVFAVPLPVAALVRAVQADDDMARALLAKQNSVIAAALSRTRSEGRIEGRIEAVIQILESRGVALSDVERAQLLAERDPSRVQRWVSAAITCASVADLLAT